MSKKISNKYENDFHEYDEDTDFSVYDEDLEESVRESRRARREAKQRRRVKKAEKTAPEPEPAETETAVGEPNGNIKIKSARKRRYKDGKKIKTVSVQANEPRPKKKKKGCLHKLLTLVLLLLCAYGAYVGGIMIWTYLNPEVVEDFPMRDIPLAPDLIVNADVPDRTIVLLMVTDEDKTRTDSMVLANYDNINKKLTLVSIPRDIMVEVTDEDFRIMRSEYPEPSVDGQVMKMNHIHHYGGEAHGVELLLNEIKVHFDVVPDYYVKVDFDGFNAIVDSIGGVEFDVPQDMDYEDPTQGLAIHLKKGMQVLDGSQAQQLVRFRKDNYGGGYVNGDIDRLQVQQAFMKAFMAKALKSDTIFKNLLGYLSAFNKYVTTNATVNDMVRYASVLKSLNMQNVTTYTLPCTPSEYGEYELDEAEAKRLIYNVFKKPLDEVKKDIETEAAEAGLEKSNDKKIQVLNGGYTDGMAREIMARFNEKQIDVAALGTFTGTKTEKTVIYTARDGIGLDLVKFFYNGADVVTDPEKTGEYDIVVVVGINEPLEKGGAAVTSEFANEAPQVIEDTEQDDDSGYYDDDDSSYDEDYDYDDDYDDYDDDDEDYDNGYDDDEE
ncbi:MAG: LCP family protein [Firmicutes bacterium]|nr:LCP family protein [Bacillota bacterium]